jgi:hypothetical protein
MGELSHVVATLLSAAVESAPEPSTKPFPVELTPDPLAQLNDILTVVAIVVGGIFAYYKFLVGIPPPGLRVRASLVSHPDQRRSVVGRDSAGVLAVEVTIANPTLLPRTVPRDSTQLISVSSITMEQLTRAGPDLTQGAMSWKEPDAYFASANILLDNGQPPDTDLKLKRGQGLYLAAVFPVPKGHHAVAFLVVMNSYTVAYVRSGWRFRRTGFWSEVRTLVVPSQGSTCRTEEL